MQRSNGRVCFSRFCYALDVFVMKLWLLTNEVVTGYDTYDSAVVAAPDEATARMTHPLEYKDDWDGEYDRWPCWCRAEDVVAKYIGEASPETEAGVICASFNAG